MEAPDTTPESIPSIKKDWGKWIGWIFAGIGFAFSVFVWLESKEEREPILLQDPVRTEIVSSDRTSDAPIMVLRSDSTKIEGDVTSVRYYFWNDGKEAIKRENVLEPVRITIEDEDAEIMDFNLVNISREVTGLSVRRSDEMPERSLVIGFAILEKDDGGSIQIIYEGSPNARFTESGIIEGAGTVKKDINDPPYIWIVTTLFYLFFLTLILLVGVSIYKRQVRMEFQILKDEERDRRNQRIEKAKNEHRLDILDLLKEQLSIDNKRLEEIENELGINRIAKADRYITLAFYTVLSLLALTILVGIYSEANTSKSVPSSIIEVQE